MSLFNEDYFEHGVEKGLSLYENFRWMPERTIPEAHWIAKHLGLEENSTIIDYGCAKGFHVKALLLLGYDAYGYDISDYALRTTKYSVEGRCTNIISRHYDFGFCKDVLEHCECYTNLVANLFRMRSAANSWLIIVPNAVNNRYVISEYENDKTHRLRLDVKTWNDYFISCGYKIKRFYYLMYGLKNNWAKYRDGNLFYILES